MESYRNGRFAHRWRCTPCPSLHSDCALSSRLAATGGAWQAFRSLCVQSVCRRKSHYSRRCRSMLCHSSRAQTCEHRRRLSHCSSRVRALPLRRQAPDELLGLRHRALLLQRPSSRSLATTQADVRSFQKDAEGAAGRRPLEAALQHHVHVCRAVGLQRQPVLCLGPRCLQPPCAIRHHVPVRRTSFTCCNSRDVDSVPDDRQGWACV
jgi:hypothetical protein